MVCDYIFSNWKTLSRIWFQMYPSLRIRWINFVHWRSFHKIEKIITTLLRFYSCVKHMLIYKRFKWSPSIRCILIVLLSIYNTMSCISIVSQCTFTSIPYTVRFNKLFVALRVPLIRWPLFKGYSFTGGYDVSNPRKLIFLLLDSIVWSRVVKIR